MEQYEILEIRNEQIYNDTLGDRVSQIAHHWFHNGIGVPLHLL